MVNALETGNNYDIALCKFGFHTVGFNFFNLLDDEDFEYEKTLAEQAKAAREREEELYLQQLEEQKLREKQLEKEREERLRRERLELMKLKSGVISDEEATIKEEHTEKTELHGKAWLSNFIYHYKFMIIFVAFLIVVTTFIIIDTIRREKADLTVVMIANNANHLLGDPLPQSNPQATNQRNKVVLG